MNAKSIIEQLKYTGLSGEQSRECMRLLTSNEIASEQKTAILSLIEGRKPSLAEIKGFAGFILENCIVPFETNEDLMDVCGTGGDGNNTLNISTLTALILAATGIKIVKHGNYGVTSVNGSSGILEYFGYRFKTNSYELQNELEKFNVTFLHAPLFHPVLKNMAGVRKNMQMKTIFNILGPMVNPMKPRFRYTGVNSLQTARNYHFLYAMENICYNIVHSIDGNDELTLTDAVKIYSHKGERLIHKHELSLVSVSLADLCVVSMDDAAKKFMDVLDFKGPAAVIETVVCNAAMAYTLRNEKSDYALAKNNCREVLVNGKVKELFKGIIK
jgi:anthranilate phosphoribosyltransferase